MVNDRAMLAALLAAIGVALVAAIAEWLHARRVRRHGVLLFGAAGRPRAWTALAPAARVIGAAALTWGLLLLVVIDGRAGGSDPTDPDSPEQRRNARHLVIALDVSPSMTVVDAGPDGKLSRRARAADLLQSVLDRLDPRLVRTSVVAFYTSAKPVIVESIDPAVVRNVLTDLPLAQAFKDGQTNMYAGVREAAKLAAKWPAGSATLLVVSDGDTRPDRALEGVPVSIADTLVVGVGSPTRGSFVGGHNSRQDASSLRTLAARLRGQYWDGNFRHLPSATLAGLSMLSRPEDAPTPVRTLALVATGVGAGLVGLTGPALAMLGWPSRRRAAAISPRITDDAANAANTANTEPTMAGTPALAGATR